MGSILFAVAPLYVLIAIGVVLRLIVASDAWIEVFNKFGVYVGFPAIVFSSLVKIPAGAIIETSVIACNVLFLLVAVALTYGVGRCLRLTTALRNTYVIGVFYGNVAYLGYPFVTTVIPGSEASVSIHIAIYVAFLFTVGIFVLELSKDGGSVNLPRIAKSIMTSPLLLSVVAGLAFSINRTVIAWIHRTRSGTSGRERSADRAARHWDVHRQAADARPAPGSRRPAQQP
jgi:predicted permease